MLGASVFVVALINLIVFNFVFYGDWRLNPGCGVATGPLLLGFGGDRCSFSNIIFAGPVCLTERALFRLLSPEEVLCTYIM